MKAAVSPDAKSVACEFKATAYADAPAAPDTSIEHQVVALFNLDTKQWRIIDQIDQAHTDSANLVNQYLSLLGFSSNSKYVATTNTRTETTYLQRLAGMPFNIPSRQTTVTMWDVKTQKSINSLKNVENPNFLSSTGCILNVPTTHPQDLMHLTTLEEKIELWNMLTGKRELSFEPVLFEVTSGGDQYDNIPLAFSSDGKLLAASICHTPVLSPGQTHAPAPSSEIKIYDTRSGKAIRTLPIHSNRMAFSEDGKTLVSCETGVEAWDLTSGKQLWKVPMGATGPSYREEMCVAGNRVLTYTERTQPERMGNSTYELIRNGTHDTQVFDLTTGKLVRDFGIDRDYTEHVMLTPDGKKMVHFSSKHSDPTVTIYDVDTAKLLTTIKCPMDTIMAILDRKS
jgi:WD40 repeat protein